MVIAIFGGGKPWARNNSSRCFSVLPATLAGRTLTHWQSTRSCTERAFARGCPLRAMTLALER
ncbi:hypothetical protein D9M71_661910 [compost metagenome]